MISERIVFGSRKARASMRVGAFLAALWIAASCLPLPARAAGSGFSAVLAGTEGRPGDLAELAVSYDGTLGLIGAFSIRVGFDADSFEYSGVREGDPVRDGYTETLGREGSVSTWYAAKESESCLSSSGTLFTYRFKVKETAQPGEADFLVSVSDVADPAPEYLEGGGDFSLSCTVLPELHSDASLLALEPKEGALEPEFSPDRLDYHVTVPFEVAALTFEAEPAEGAVCKINRKNLGAGGSDTLFRVTVTAEDKETKTEYRVVVHRQEKETSSTPEAEPTPEPEKTAPPAEAKASSKPKETKNPKETRGPKETKEPKGSPAPVSEQEQAEPSAMPQAPAAAAVSSAPGDYSLVINNGSTSAWPAIGAGLFLGVMVILSAPLSRLICAKFPQKEEKEKEEKEKGP